MGHLAELQSFFKSIENSSVRSLSSDLLIKNFLEYMYNKYGYDEAYYRKGFNNENLKYKNFNEYIYKYYMGLNKDLSMEYKRLEEEYKEHIHLYKERVNQLSIKVKSIPSNEKYKRGKYKFFLHINEELLRKAKEKREKTNIFKEALSNCRQLSNLSFNLWSYDNTFYDIRQYEDIDWKSKINFLEASIREEEKLAKMKYHNHEQYLLLFKKYIDENNILERLKVITAKNYYLKDRREIIDESINLFKNNNYVPFVYLLIPQIEGLFEVYKTILGINNDEMHNNGLVDKLDSINEQKGLWGYVYYAFEFPVLRNNIAHGNMVPITLEIAYDTLMDIFYLFHEIESNDLEYKIILEFLEDFSYKQVDEECIYVLNYFSSDLLCGERLKWLKKCLDGNYDSMLAWYNQTDTFNRLKELFKSNKFRVSIYNYELLETSEYMDVEGKQIKFIELNRKVEEYIPMLELLKSYVDFPKKWLFDVEQRINDINKKVEERHQYIESLTAKRNIQD